MWNEGRAKLWSKSVMLENICSIYWRVSALGWTLQKNIHYTLVIIFQAFWKLLLLAMIYHFGDINTIRHGMIFWQNICRKSKYWPNRWMDFIVIEVKQSGNQIWVGSSILPKNEQNSLSWVEKILRIVSFVRFFERIEDTINTFEIYWSFTQSLKILNLFVSLMLIA